MSKKLLLVVLLFSLVLYAWLEELAPAVKKTRSEREVEGNRALVFEAERRGWLSPEMQALVDEARRRGIFGPPLPQAEGSEKRPEDMSDEELDALFESVDVLLESRGKLLESRGNRQLVLEVEQRGWLSPEMQALVDEARRHGIFEYPLPQAEGSAKPVDQWTDEELLEYLGL
ncbi:MAG: hypothetical protein G8D66_13325 [gamma proteobacterium symbiont of Ctena orbiculata]